jgi:hypothetical protein
MAHSQEETFGSRTSILHECCAETIDQLTLEEMVMLEPPEFRGRFVTNSLFPLGAFQESD